jgi:gliding motility associated protien GldN
MQAQESLRERLAKRQQQEQGTVTDSSLKVPKLSVRAEMMNENQTQDLSNATWVREIYRFLDLTKGENAALYYPEQPENDKMNLFTMIFKLMENNSLPIYRWNNGNDLFTDRMKEDFGDILSILEIPYQKNGENYVYDEFSIPNNEALGYYIKEAWYFDRSNSVLGVKTVAICPVVIREEYFSDESSLSTLSRRPLFWIPYEYIRPYAARMPVMTSDRNNVMTKTIDDYFRLRLYEGEIYKTTNMENKLMVEKYKDPESLKQAQGKIEGELKQFEENLWVVNDSINDVPSKNKAKNTGASKISKPKGGSSGTAYSARDRR